MPTIPPRPGTRTAGGPPATPPARTPVHVRTIRLEAVRVGPDELEVTGHLVDERPGGTRWFGIERGPVVHDMSVTLAVRYPDLVIIRATAEMRTYPYTVCPDAVPGLQQLVGLSVVQGFSRAVHERLGRDRGCAHLTALIQAMGPVVRQGAGAAFRDDREVPRPEDRWFVNTCQAWREGGELHRRLAAGDLAGLRALSTGVGPEAPPRSVTDGGAPGRDGPPPAEAGREAP